MKNTQNKNDGGTASELEKVAEKAVVRICLAAVPPEKLFDIAERDRKVKGIIIQALHEVADLLRAENEKLIKLIQDKKFDMNHLDTVLDYCPICTCDTLKKQIAVMREALEWYSIVCDGKNLNLIIDGSIAKKALTQTIEG